MKRLDAHAASPEARFARRVVQRLDDSLALLPAGTLERLAVGRKAALRAQRAPRPAEARQPAVAGIGTDHDLGPERFGFARIGLVFSLVLLVGACLAGLYDLEQDRRIEELADVDSAVLSDDLPISAYADHGFNAFLKQNP